MTFGDRVRQAPAALRALTGLRPAEYTAFEREVLPRLAAAEQARHQRPTRQRAIGAGHPFELTARGDYSGSRAGIGGCPAKVRSSAAKIGRACLRSVAM